MRNPDGLHDAGGLTERSTGAIRIAPRAGIVITMAAFLGLVAFFWPFVVAPGKLGAAYAPP